MKNRGFIIPVIIIVIIIIFGIAAAIHSVYERHSSTTAMSSATTSFSDSVAHTSTSTAVAVNTGLEASTSLRDLLTSDKNATCQFSYSSFSNSVSGTLYFANPLMRGDLTVKSGSAAALQTSILRSGGEVYLWSGNQGIEMTADNFKTSVQSPDTSINLDQNVNYTCTSATPDPSKFKLPGGTIFVPVSPPAK